MKVRFFYQHFWPDSPPYASMQRTIGAHLVGEGHRVSVITAQPSYKAGDRATTLPATQSLDGIRVRRLSRLPGAGRFSLLRAAQKALFPVRAALHVIARRIAGKRDDVIVAATIPPVINGLCAWFAARLTGARFVYHLQDIHPEIDAVGGLWSADSLRHRVLRRLDIFVCARAQRCVVLSSDMRDALHERGLDTGKVIIINNVMPESHAPIVREPIAPESTVSPGPSADPADPEPPAVPAARAARGRPAGPAVRKLVFAGNLGRFQGLEQVLDGFIAHHAATAGTGPACELHFLGDGVAKDSLLARAGAHEAVHFHAHRSIAAAAHFIAGCDAGIVSIAADVHRYAWPSKTQIYLGLGVPLFAVVGTGSALAGEVRDHDLGIVSARDPSSLADGFERLERWLDNAGSHRERLLAHHRRAFSSADTLARWSGLIDDLSSPARRKPASAVSQRGRT